MSHREIDELLQKGRQRTGFFSRLVMNLSPAYAADWGNFSYHNIRRGYGIVHGEETLVRRGTEGAAQQWRMQYISNCQQLNDTKLLHILNNYVLFHAQEKGTFRHEDYVVTSIREIDVNPAQGKLLVHAHGLEQYRLLYQYMRY